MQLSFHADYACRVLIYLAVVDDQQSSIAAVAKAYAISENHLVKVVHHLGKLGYLTTTRGRGGGIKLARTPAEINIGEVVRAMEPHFTVVECLDQQTNTCPIVPVCGLKAAISKATAAFLATLDDYSLQDVLRDKHQLSGLLTQKL